MGNNTKVKVVAEFNGSFLLTNLDTTIGVVLSSNGVFSKTSLTLSLFSRYPWKDTNLRWDDLVVTFGLSPVKEEVLFDQNRDVRMFTEEGTPKGSGNE